MAVVRLPVLLGPTAVGKSAVAERLATTGPVTIVVADSRQVYRGFDIGTAKPSRAIRDAVPHAMLDVADPGDRWNAAQWAAGATGAIEAALRAGRRPLIVGGTGLYVRALFEPLFEEPPLDPEQRAALALELAPLDVETLRARVRELDPPRAHLGRTQLLRALEVAMLTGRSMSEWHVLHARVPRFSPSYLVLERGETLAGRIEERVDAMLRAGWMEEVLKLRARVPNEAPAWNATGYVAIRDVVTGVRDLVAARQEVIIRTRQYAKRQRTWFRHQLPAAATCRVDVGHTASREAIERWWHTSEERP